MIGLIASQIRITGDLEKDQQLLIYGIGALIGLIVLAMIVILVIVLVRRGKASRAAAMAASTAQLPTEDTYKPVVAVETPAESPVSEPAKEEQPEPPVVATEPDPIPKEANPSVPVALIAPEEEPSEKTDEPVPQKKYDFGAYKEELSHQNPDDKMEEIRRRLEEIKRQRHTEPAPVLPKLEANPPAHEITPASELEHDPIVSEEEILAEEEMDETRPINEVPDPEAVSITEVPQMERLEPAEPPVGTKEEPAVSQEPSMGETPVAPVEEPPTPQEPPMEETPAARPVEKEEKPEREEIRSEGETYYTLPNEPVMELQRDPQPEPVEKPKPQKAEPAESHFPNGKFLPMKKLTFAEWVELFK